MRNMEDDASPEEDDVAQACEVLGPPDGRASPRYSGLATFARLPRVEDVTVWDVGVLGVPFDGGTNTG